MLKHQDVWRGRHNGFSYKIVKWKGYENKPIWNYYIIIDVRQLPHELISLFDLKPYINKYGRFSHDYDGYYDEEEFKLGTGFATLEWHGGITYYDKQICTESNLYYGTVTAGCDYNHYCDEEQTYSLDAVFEDVKNTINDLIEQYPSLLVWCNQCGSFVNKESGEFKNTEIFICQKCIGKRAFKNEGLEN